MAERGGMGVKFERPAHSGPALSQHLAGARGGSRAPAQLAFFGHAWHGWPSTANMPQGQTATSRTAGAPEEAVEAKRKAV